MQVWVYLILHVARQEAQFLASLDGRARQDDFLGGFLFQSFDGQRNGQVGLTRSGRSYGKHHVVVVIGVYQPLLVFATGLDGASRHGVAYHTVGHVVLGAIALNDVQDVLFAQAVEFQHVLSYLLGVFFKGSHLFLVAQNAYHVVAGHDAQLGIQGA